MIPILGTALNIELFEGLVLLGFWRHARNERQRKLFNSLGEEPKKVPVLDSVFRELAGIPTVLQQKMAKRAIRSVRRVIGSQAAEYIAVGLMNPKSPLRGWLAKQAPPQPIPNVLRRKVRIVL